MSTDLAHNPPRRRSFAWLIAALAAGPAAWSAQLVLGYGVAGYECFRGRAPLTQPPPGGWSGEVTALLAVNAVCLALTLGAAGIAARGWFRKDHSGAHRFLAACGLLASFGFALAILFDTAVILGVPACWNIPS